MPPGRTRRAGAGRAASALHLIVSLALVIVVAAALPCDGRAQSRVTIAPVPAAVPAAVRSSRFVVTLNGRRTPVVHAAGSLCLLNFDTEGPVEVTVTAQDPHFWDRGVLIQPMRLGIRPVLHGATLRFRIPGPEKLSISRPGDHFGDAAMLFLFANPPDHSGIIPTTPGVRYFGPGVYHQSIDAHSGDTIYLAAGAVLFGSLNFDHVQNVHVLGRGMVIYDGPQTPADDTGWMQRPDWHAIWMDHAENIEIDGITTVVRSRTWQIQMKDSRHIGFYNIKAIAATPGDANGDGMDWLGGGATTVRDSFLRASDDVFALQGNWNGYTEAEMRTPGHDVTDLTLTGNLVSTSISNTMRVGWPEKIFSTAHVHMSDTDVLDTGYGDCKVPFAFFELWADPGGQGTHTDYSFRDIRLENWYSLFQVRYPNPAVRGLTFAGLWSMDAPAMAPPVLLGDVRNVTLQHVPVTQGRPVQVLDGAQPPVIEPAPGEGEPAPGLTQPAPSAPGFTYSAGLLRPRHPVIFTVTDPAPGTRYTWLFGDGAAAAGGTVRHSFPDAEGTLLDHTGRFRVLLHAVAADGSESWTSRSVVVGEQLQPAASSRSAPLPSGATLRTVQVPADGGYTFWILTRTPLTVSLDGGAPTAAPTPRPIVCGSGEAAVQPITLSGVLAAGPHTLLLQGQPGDPAPVIVWEGPGVPRQPLEGR